jgi:hypothetical protein
MERVQESQGQKRWELAQAKEWELRREWELEKELEME